MIDATLRAFLEQGLSLHVATRDRDMRPVGARALALRVDEDRVHLTVYVAQVAMERLLVSLDASRQVAVDIGRPEDDRACQVKGVFERAGDAAADDRAFIEAQYAGFMRQLEIIGTAGEHLRSWTTWPAVAVRIRVTALYSQTPGPDAGAPLS